MDTIQDQRRLEQVIFDTIMGYYNGNLPKIVYIVINPSDCKITVIPSGKLAASLPKQNGTVIEAIQTENFSNAITEVAANYFNAR